DRLFRQPIYRRTIEKEIEGIQLRVACGGGITIEIGAGRALLVQLLNSPAGPCAQLVDRAELDRLGRAGFGARRDQAIALSVVAKRAFVSVPIIAAARDDAEGTGRHAVGAAVTDVRLNEDVAELILHDRVGGTRLLAGSRDAVLAGVAHHQPSPRPGVR